ncbi:MAG: LytTR family transcriptional regulator, partial [Prevotellaceae bacterium]|nr:LytTR family transcriptional regulator [Candidatus Minthosoma equi]
IPTTLYICSINLGFQTLCYWIRNLYRERNELQAINEMLKLQQECDAMQNVSDSAPCEENQCVLHSDYNGQNININPHNFIYVESVGNYANLCFIDNEQLTTTTIRTTIKQLKEDLSGNDFIVQCHRGFLVNLEYVESMEESNGRFFLNMFCSEKKIPVSRVNKSTIKDTLAALRCK